jgi:hypothetical protein
MAGRFGLIEVRVLTPIRVGAAGLPLFDGLREKVLDGVGHG